MSLSKTLDGPIGIFDSGYGGLTVLDSIRQQLPQYDYLYLGDNARNPYGPRSFEVVYQFTLQAVKKLFEMGCPLVILACNTASAKALRSIQQNDLPNLDSTRRVLGVIRPTVEAVGTLTQTHHIGVMGTVGTIRSQSYTMEVDKLYGNMHVIGEPCPMWVPLVENNEYNSPGADYFIKRHIDNLLAQDKDIDCVILGCTHYPLLLKKIQEYMPPNIQVISQGNYVASSLANYLERHPEISSRCRHGGHTEFFTTESPEQFQQSASIFLQEDIDVQHITL